MSAFIQNTQSLDSIVKGVICVVFMHLLLDVVLPDAATATDQRLELTERDRVYPIVSKCLSIHVCFWSSLDLIKCVNRGQRKAGSTFTFNEGWVQDTPWCL